MGYFIIILFLCPSFGFVSSALGQTPAEICRKTVVALANNNNPSFPPTIHIARLTRELDLQDTPFSGGSSAAIAQDIFKVTNAVRALLPTLAHPSDIAVEVHSMPNNAAWDYKRGVVIWSETFPESSVPGYRESVLAHEYAHMVFDQNLAIYCPAWAPIKKIHEQLGQVYGASAHLEREFFLLQGKLSSLKEKGGHSTEIKTLQRRSKELIAEYQPYARKLDELRRLLYRTKIEELKVPYEELFSDVVQITVAKNPSIAKNGRFRDFLTRFSEQEIRDWQDGGDKHHTFDPVRSYLWHHHLSKVSSESERSKLVTAIFHVIASELATREQNSALHDLSVGELNLRMIRALDAHLGHLK